MHTGKGLEKVPSMLNFSFWQNFRLVHAAWIDGGSQLIACFGLLYVCDTSPKFLPMNKPLDKTTHQIISSVFLFNKMSLPCCGESFVASPLFPAAIALA